MDARNDTLAARRSTAAARAWGPILALVGLAATAQAQGAELRPRWLPQKPATARILAGEDPTRLVLKLRDDAGARARGGELLSGPGGADVAQVRARLASAGSVRVRPLFTLLPGELQAMRLAGEGASGQALADLTQYFELRLPPRADARALLEALLALDLVENAYAHPRPAPPPGDYAPSTPDYRGQQGYAGAAPIGLGTAAVAALAGGKGQGARIADIEYSWNLKGLFGDSTSHEDLQVLEAQSPAPPLGNVSTWVDPFNDTNHGTAVAGIAAADDDTFGVSGLATGATLRLVAANTSAGYSVANAVALAARRLGAGGVVLIEQQSFGPNWSSSTGQFGMVPVEHYDAEFNAIRMATALCVHVVEAAGNGSQDLDDLNGGLPGTPGVSTGDPSYAKFNLAVRDSGAVVVGAATSTTPHGPMGFTNLGRRVDAYAWGENVVTLGYGDLFNAGSDQLYTATFGGTSSASALVASAAAILQAAHFQQTGLAVLKPAALRLLLRSSGTPSGGALDRIGRQPDLADQHPITGVGPHPSIVHGLGATGDQAGRAVRGAGDVDLDGYGDVLVASPWSQLLGEVWLLSGSTGERVTSYLGEGPAEDFGDALTALDDLDGDGSPDVLIGARANGAGGPSAGRAYVFNGLGAPLYALTGAAGDELGAAVASLGDVDGDLRGDFAVAAPGTNAGQGRVLVHSGATGSLLYLADGELPGDRFGEALDGIADLDGDGLRDLLVGAPFHGGAQTGKAYVLSGANGAIVATFFPGVAGSGFGAAVAGGSDVDGDGVEDPLVGAPLFDGAGTDRGRVYVYSGATGQLVRTHDGEASLDRFGHALAGLGDVDRDGFGELLVGAPHHQGSAGRAYVLRGSSGAALATFDGEAANHQLGRALASAGDVDADGRPDWIVGAPYSDLKGMTDAGRAYVFLAPPGKALLASQTK